MELYSKGLELTKKINHKFYIRKFEYLLSDLGRTAQTTSIDEFKNYPISELTQMIQNFYFRQIDKIPDIRLKEGLKIAGKDHNPTEILRDCEFLAVDYIPSTYGQLIESILEFNEKKFNLKDAQIWLDNIDDNILEILQNISFHNLGKIIECMKKYLVFLFPIISVQSSIL